MVDYYTTLGIAKDADDSTIKKAYRKMAMKYHPDKNNGDEKAAETFKAISQAYDTLSDPEKRSIYDKYGEEGIQQMEGGGHPVNPSDIFEQMFGGMGGGMFGGRKRGASKKISRTTANIDLKTFVRGGNIKVQFSDTIAKNLTTGETSLAFEICNTCKGTCSVMHTRMVGPGMFQQSRGACEACDGRGFQLSNEAQTNCIWIDKVKEYEVYVPAGRSLQKPLVMFEKGGMCIDPHSHEVKQCDLHVQLKCNTKESDEWQLYSHQHRHLQWTPTLQVVYGMVTHRLKCVHPNGKEYILEMPKKRLTESFVATGLGLPASEDGQEPAGDLIIKVLWDFNTTNIEKMPWLVQMKTGLHERAPWTNDKASKAHATCLTTDEYETYQREGHRSNPSRGFASEMGGDDGENGGMHAQECVQS